MGLLVSDVEELQIEALKRGATPEEASLNGKLPRVEMITPSEGDPEGRTAVAADTAVAEEAAVAEDTAGAPISDISRPIPEEVLTQLSGPDTVGTTGTPIDERSFTAGSVPPEETEAEVPVEDSSDIFMKVTSQDSADVFQSVTAAPASISTAYLEKRALDLTAIKARMDPLRDREMLMRESMKELSGSMSTEDVFNMYQQQAAEQLSQSGLQAIEQSLQLESTATQEEVVSDIEAITAIPALYRGPAGESRLFVDVTAPVSVPEQIKAEIAATDFSWQTFAAFTEKLGVFDKYGSSILGLLFIPDFIKDTNDLVGGSYLKTGDNLKALISEYQNLPADQKPARFLEIFEDAKVAYESNPWKIAGLVSLLNDPEFVAEANIEMVLGAFDAISMGASFLPYKTIKGIARARSLNNLFCIHYLRVK
jgi:hypothetical protein